MALLERLDGDRRGIIVPFCSTSDEKGSGRVERLALSPNKRLRLFMLVGSPANLILQSANALLVFAPPFAVYFLGLAGFLLYAAIGLVQTLVGAVEGRRST